MENALTILDHLQFDCPTAQQRSALLGMSNFIAESNKNDFYILCGAAGTGKTSITTALIGYLNSKAINYKIAAPTGRAARILGRKSKTVNSTIHSLIYSTKPNPETGEVIFELKENTIKETTIYIIDEASMVSSTVNRTEGSMFTSKNSLLSDLIIFIKNGNPENKIVFLGDKNQLPPVNETDSKALCLEYLKAKFQLNGTAHLLTEEKRQEDGSYILKNAVSIREGIDANIKKVKLQGVEQQTISQASSAYVKEYLNNGFESIVSIGATHKMNKMFNNVVREKLFGSRINTLETSDLLIVTSTWRRNDFQLYSGDHVTVVEVKTNDTEQVAGLHFVPVKLLSKSIQGIDEIIEDYILLESILNPEGLKLEQENRLRHERFTKNKVYRESGNAADDRYIGAIRATYGHSITCNKAQGGEWDKVFLNSFFIPSLKYQYTAVTRAKSSLILY
ncbi:ATP-dependent RecD-like DNA helicase [Flavobacterium sp. CECT 9288]|uniref:ATP-dependent DNA helicase n=1 Tax=Flavobacterium sp. CECT 9288 TaxID=2845819 RepID=UPI001E3446B0|nr:AAA family ATPase [Flavobacterium sp. CECT 9288]CAH0336596.1 ATP-dependent RecD-like DNA helicase [Flavobacterium sp. CECT 9288]